MYSWATLKAEFAIHITSQCSPGKPTIARFLASQMPAICTMASAILVIELLTKCLHVYRPWIILKGKDHFIMIYKTQFLTIYLFP